MSVQSRGNMSVMRRIVSVTVVMWGVMWGVLASAPRDAQAAPPREASAARQSTQRHALIIGANQGGAGRETLRYAIKDARAMAEVLEELGGVERAQMLEEPSVKELDEELDTLQARLEGLRKDRRLELILYYSGHSDERGLLLSGKHYDYKQLRERLEAMPVDVRVVILDSCASGNVTRSKGGKRAPAFLDDGTTQVSGLAFITSSSADESSQESDRLEGSFFTHALISGLRGAADHTGDRRVTLNEAYQFAFQETLSHTEQTLGGAQHAAYDFQLTGHGELVLTDYGQAGEAVLQFSRQMRGRIFVRDSDQRLVTEFVKQPGRELEVALPPRRYQVLVQMEGRAGRASVKLRGGKTERLTEEGLEEVPLEMTAAKGDADQGGFKDRRKIPLGLDFLPYVGVSSFWPEARRNFSFNVLAGKSGGVNGLEISGLGSLASGPVSGVQIAGLSNAVIGALRGAQVGGVLNVASRGANGVQVGAANVVGDDLTGGQVGAFNLTRGGLVGAQLGAVNMQLFRVPSRGGQIGAVNLAQDLSGMQVGAVNLQLFGETSRGVQVGALNLSQDLQGVQLGAVNLDVGSRDAKGGLVQVGAVNLAREPVAGFMFGAVNVAPTATASFGVINVFWKERVRVSGWLNSEGGLQAGVKNGSRSTYNIYSVGVQTWPREGGTERSGALSPSAYSLGLTYGWRHDLFGSARWGVQVDGTAQMLFKAWRDLGSMNSLYKLRLGATYALGDRVTLYGGPSANVLVTEQAARGLFLPFGARVVTPSSSDVQVALWPGVYLGADFF